jgi:CRP-like cAMP-binding protein
MHLNERVAAHPFFHGMKPEHLGILAEGATEAKFEPEQFLFREGEPANRFYLIENGHVTLEAHEPANGTAFVQQLGAGEVLGWSWLFPPFVWHFRARVTELTDAIVLSGAHLLMAVERDPNFGFELMKRVTQVVIHRLQATRQQLIAAQLDSVLKG